MNERNGENWVIASVFDYITDADIGRYASNARRPRTYSGRYRGPLGRPFRRAGAVPRRFKPTDDRSNALQRCRAMAYDRYSVHLVYSTDITVDAEDKQEAMEYAISLAESHGIDLRQSIRPEDCYVEHIEWRDLYPLTYSYGIKPDPVACARRRGSVRSYFARSRGGTEPPQDVLAADPDGHQEPVVVDAGSVLLEDRGNRGRRRDGVVYREQDLLRRDDGRGTHAR